MAADSGVSHAVDLDLAATCYSAVFSDVCDLLKVSALNGCQPSRVYALPLFVTGLDGSPCTIVAETGR